MEKNLLLRESGRLLMLETVRAYARELLERDDRGAEVRLRHCRHFVALAETATPHLRTHAEAEWMERLDAETDNFRAALDWALREGQPALAVRLAGRLGRYWELRGGSAEGGRWLRAAIEAADDEVPLEDRARALRAEVVMLEDQGSWYDADGSQAASRSIASEAVALSRRAGDPAGIADALLHLSGFEHGRARAHAGAGGGGAPLRSRSGRRGAHRRRARSSRALVPDRRCRRRDRRSRSALSQGRRHPRTCRGLQQRGLRGHHAGQLRTRGRISGRSARPGGEDRRAAQASCGVSATSESLSLFTADFERAGARFAEQLRLCREHGVSWMAAEGIAGLAAIAALPGRAGARRTSARRSRIAGERPGRCGRRHGSSRSSSRRLGSDLARRVGAPRTRTAPRLGFDEAVSLALGRRLGALGLGR